MAWRLVIGIAVGLIAVWSALLVVLWILSRRLPSWRDSIRLVPDIARMLRGLVGDRRVPRSARAAIWFLLIFLANPIDLVPDFFPVLGYADDAIVAYAVLRFVIKRAGVDAARRHWAGDEASLRALMHLMRVP